MKVSQQKQKQNISTQNYTLSEILFICISKWYWFVAALAITIGYTLYKNITTPPIYTRNTEVLIKSENKGGISEQMENFANMGTHSSTTNAYNEIYTFRTPETITETIKRLGLYIEYSYKGTYYPIALYGNQLPIKITPCDFDIENVASFNIDITPEKTFRLYDFTGGAQYGPNEINGSFGNDTITLVNSRLGDIIIELNTKAKIKGNTTITVNLTGLQNAAEKYGSRMSFALLDEESEIITISTTDNSIERADDILATIVDVYNEIWVREKNKEAEGAKEFIEGRLAYINEELDSIDDNISSFKSENLIPDIKAQSNINITAEREITRRKASVRNELEQAEHFLRSIKENIRSSKLLPMNSRISSANINSQISAYNLALINRNNLRHREQGIRR